MEMKKRDPMPTPHEDDEKSGVRRAIDDVKRGVSDAVMDVKEGVGRVTNSPRYGSHGSRTGQAVVCVRVASTSHALPLPMTDGVAKLQECLRGELSAVETYDLAMHAMHDAELTRALLQLRESHERRVMLLRDRLHEDGATPDAESGAWGAFAKLVQKSADLFGSRAAMRALEEGEDHGLKLYSADLGDCDMSTREFILVQLLPEQQRSRRPLPHPRPLREDDVTRSRRAPMANSARARFP